MIRDGADVPGKFLFGMPLNLDRRLLLSGEKGNHRAGFFTDPLLLLGITDLHYWVVIETLLYLPNTSSPE